MAKNQRYSNALHINIPVPDGIVSGSPVRVGQICGVAQTARDTDGNATVWLNGSWELDVANAVAAVGEPIYINTTGGLTTASSSTSGTVTTQHYVWGVALGTKGTGTGPLEVAPLGYTNQIVA